MPMSRESVPLVEFGVARTCAHQKISKITAARVLDCRLLVHRQQIVEYDLRNIIVTMSRKVGRADPRVERTVAYLLRCPRSTVPEAMRASKFSLDESRDAAKQMAVRRAYGKASGGKATHHPPNQVETLSATTSTLSPLTNSPQRLQMVSLQLSTPRRSPRKLPSPKLKPKPRLIRKSLRAMQKARVNKLSSKRKHS
jgi:hypothetical protein